jgi:hypothetical protein
LARRNTSIVADEVLEHLPQPPWIAGDPQLRPVGAQIDRARHAEHAHDVAHERNEIELFEFEREFVLLES